MLVVRGAGWSVLWWDRRGRRVVAQRDYTKDEWGACADEAKDEWGACADEAPRDEE
jgi:hypothetical protein